jgi:hypothetical protein
VRSHPHYGELRNHIWNELRPTVLEGAYERHSS